MGATLPIQADKDPTVSRTPLEEPHPDYPQFTRAALYDTISMAYLDCPDDHDVAEILSESFSIPIEPPVARRLRQEAARVATLPETTPERKRRWIHRYRHLTVNNLVKEYMFLEGVGDFLASKVKLAHEMFILLRDTPRNRLWIAVNEAVGRNNVELEILNTLIRYGETASQVFALADTMGRVTGKTADEQMNAVCRQLRVLAAQNRDMEELGACAARILMDKTGFASTPDVVRYLLEYDFFLNNPLPENASIRLRILHGADLDDENPDLVDRLLAGFRDDLAPDDISRLIPALRNGPFLESVEFDAIGNRADRKAAALLEKDPEHPVAIHWKTLQSVAGNLATITDFSRFYTPQELASARIKKILPTSLQAGLDRLNKLNSVESVRGVLKFLNAGTAARTFPFPADRYLNLRFDPVGL